MFLRTKTGLIHIICLFHARLSELCFICLSLFICHFYELVSCCYCFCWGPCYSVFNGTCIVSSVVFVLCIVSSVVFVLCIVSSVVCVVSSVVCIVSSVVCVVSSVVCVVSSVVFVLFLMFCILLFVFLLFFLFSILPW